jgi:hypothetical protein
MNYPASECGSGVGAAEQPQYCLTHPFVVLAALVFKPVHQGQAAHEVWRVFETNATGDRMLRGLPHGLHPVVQSDEQEGKLPAVLHPGECVDARLADVAAGVGGQDAQRPYTAERKRQYVLGRDGRRSPLRHIAHHRVEL